MVPEGENDDHRCEVCGVWIEECSFCDWLARHFIEGDTIPKDVYFCDRHVRLLVESLNEGEANEQLAYEVGDRRLEMGMYAPGPDGCACDTWK